MEVFTRSFGFNLGEQQTSMMRKRYKLVQNSEIQLIHYIKQYEMKMPVNQHLAKVLPRNFKLQQQNQQLKRQVPIVKVVDEIGTIDNGDELDKKYARVLSLERYKRNLLYMEEIINPYPTKSLQLQELPLMENVDKLHVLLLIG